MTGGQVGPVRPVVPQDLAAAGSRVVLGLLAAVVASEPWERLLPSLAMVVLVGGFLGVGVLAKPSRSARAWVADVADVPLLPGVVLPTAVAVRVGLLLGVAGGSALLLAAVVATVSSAPAYVLLLPTSLVLGRSVGRLLVVRAVRRWERERDVVLCRRPSTQRFVLLHETDVERMVAVPAPGAARAT